VPARSLIDFEGPRLAPTKGLVASLAEEYGIKDRCTSPKDLLLYAEPIFDLRSIPR
jgi:hypothetical protein